MPIHLGFRDKVKLGIGVIKLGVIGMSMGGVQTHVSPGEVIAAGKHMKQAQRVTTVDSYANMLAEVNGRQQQFTPAGWADLQNFLPGIQAYFNLHNGLVAHLITHNSDPGRMKRIELETPTGNTLIAWRD